MAETDLKFWRTLEKGEEEAKRLLRAKPDTFIRGNYYNILSAATSCKWSREFIRELVGRMDDSTLRRGNYREDPPFHAACDRGWPLVAEVLLEKLPSEVMWQLTRRRLPLFACIWYGGQSVAPLLVERMPVDKLVEGNYLSTAAHEGYLDIVRPLAAKVPPSESAKAFCRIGRGDMAGVALVLINRMTAIDLEEKAPDMLARLLALFNNYEKNQELVQRILTRLVRESGKELDLEYLLSRCDQQKRYAMLFILCRERCRLSFIEQVTRQLADEDYSKPLQLMHSVTSTPLHEAVANGSRDVVEHLAEVMPRDGRSLRNRDWKSALDLAIEKGDQRIISCLQPMAKVAN